MTAKTSVISIWLMVSYVCGSLIDVRDGFLTIPRNTRHEIRTIQKIFLDDIER
jgi:hypothetical protein